MKTSRTTQAFMGASLAFVFACQIFLFVPFALYVGNSGEFAVSFPEMVAIYWRLPVMLIGIAALIAMLMPSSRFPVFLSVLATVCVLSWTQGNLLVWEYGLFDGRVIDWSDGSWRGWLETVMWVGAVLAAVIGGVKVHVPIVRIAAALFVLQAGLFIHTWSEYSPQASTRPDAEELGRTYETIHRFSATKNVVHIIADGLQSDVFEELVSEGRISNELRKQFDGFTFFREHMGAFLYTHMTLPAMLGGSIYRNQEPIEDYLNSTVGERTILNVASEAGYEVDLVVPSGGVAHIYRKGTYDNFFQVRNQLHMSGNDIVRDEAATLIDLALFRLSPHFLKEYIYNDQRWLVQSWVADEKYMSLSFFSHAVFLKRLAEQMVVDRPSPVYKLMHLMLSHNPMVTTAQCEYAGQVLRTVRVNVKNQARCGLYQVIALFDEMKDRGIYEDATIILMGDHGAWVPPKGMKAVWNGDGTTGAVINPAVLALAAPLLAVKGAGESGPLKVSDAPTSIVDTAPTVADAAGLPRTLKGTSAYDVKVDEPRERRFYAYQYETSDWSGDYLSPIEEYVVTGSVFDSASWRYNLTYHPGNSVERSSAGGQLWVPVERQQ